MSAHHPVDPNEVRAAVAGAVREHSTFFPDNPAFLAAPLPLP